MSSVRYAAYRNKKNISVCPISNKNALEMYLKEKRSNGEIHTQELLEYAQAQRDQIDEMDRAFGIWKHNQKIGTSPIFILAKIENVVSVRDFYAIQVCDLEERSEFQNILNRTYEEDREPIENIKLNDLCVVLYDWNWCRAEVIERIETMETVVYLIDYGRVIYTKKQNLFLMRKPHNMIRPFAIKCQLSFMNKNEVVSSDTEYSLSKLFENIAQQTKHFLLHLDRLELDQSDIYNVTLFTNDIKLTNSNTVYNVYMLHEVYGAFILPNMKFDCEITETWSRDIFRMIEESSQDHSKKMQVFITHIVSPDEIYVRCRSSNSFKMNKLRRIIDTYANDKTNIDHHHSNDWSIGSDCLVRLQNWNTTKSHLKQWYRGRIINKNGNSFHVFLRDYGRKAEVNCVDLKSIPAAIKEPADTVQKCCLSLTSKWTESCTNLLNDIIGEYQYFAISSVSKRASVLSFTLWATNLSSHLDNNIDTVEIWDNIGLRIVSKSIENSIEPFIKKSQRRYEKIQFRKNANFSEDSDVSSSDDYQLHHIKEYDILEDYDSNGNDLNDLTLVAEWPPSLQIVHAVFNGLVTHINERGIVFIQEENNIDAAFQLEQSIADHLQKNNVIRENHIWYEGNACFAESNNSGGYHRAVIKKINREEGTCLIYYVDYGDEVMTSLDELLPATDFGDIPVLVRKLYVKSLIPAKRNGQWSSPAAMAEFRSRLLNEMCTVCILEDTRREYKKKLILPCSIEPHILPCDIHKWLLKKKLGFATKLSENGDNILYV